MTNVERFDRKAVLALRSEEHRLLRGVARRNRKAALADLWLVLEGDYGGQIYLTVPWACVGRDAKVGELLRAIDRLCWGENGLDGARAYLYRARGRSTILDELARDSREIGETPERAAASFGFENVAAFVDANRLFVPGGMGGGHLVENALWLHDELEGRPVCTPEAQPILDAVRGASCEQVERMDWRGQAMRLLGLRAE